MSSSTYCTDTAEPKNGFVKPENVFVELENGSCEPENGISQSRTLSEAIFFHREKIDHRFTSCLSLDFVVVISISKCQAVCN